MPRPGEHAGPEPRDRLGRFVLEARLGRGAVGEVWRARHVDTGTPAAVKVVAPRWLGQPGVVEAFAHEVEASAALSHPGIVLLLDHGRVERDGIEVPWLAMELVDGGSLHAQRRRLDWPEVRRALLQLLEALAYAHARGTIHRDVKPGNVLVEEGRVKLSDFGLAHRLGQRLGDAGLIGTPSYMAPEQIRAEEDALGPWTDLYGVGCLAWTLLTGHPPFRGTGRLEVLAAHLEREPPPLEAATAVPSTVEDWLRWLLAKDPRDRPLLAADAAQALAGVTRDPRAYRPRRPSPPATWRADAAVPHRDLVRASTAAFRVRHVRLVGREHERDRLWEALQQVLARGRPLVLTLEGPIGSGRSRLAQWLRERACELGLALPLRIGPDASVGRALRQYRAVLPAGPAEAVVAALCDHRPVILEVDDGERLPEALRLVRSLCALDLPLLVVVTSDPEASAEHPGGRRLLDGLPTRRVRVERLPSNRLRELASDLLLVRGPVVDAIVERAGGSPRFVLEVLRDWVDRGLLVWTGEGLEPRPGARVELPESVRHVWEARIARALRDRPPDDAVALELGALLGSSVPIPEWERACEAAGVAPTSDLLAALDGVGLVRVDGWPPRRWSAAHGMVRDALLARAREGGRAAARHAACAHGLAAGAPEPPPPRMSARLGHHLLRAGAPDRAIDPLLASLADPDAADEHRLRDLLAALEEAAIPEADPRWGRAWNAAADVAQAVGGELDDVDWTELTVAAGLAHGWIPELAGAFARQALRLSRRGAPEAARIAARRATTFSAWLAPGDQLEVQAMVARVAAATGRHEEAMPLLERLCVRHAALGRRREAGRLALELARVLQARGASDDAGRWGEQARRWLEEAGAVAEVAACDTLVADLARERGDLAAADRAWEEASRRRRPGIAPAASRLDLGRALTLLAGGDIDAARAQAEAVLVAVRADRHPVAVAVARLVLAHFELDRGETAAALALLADVEDVVLGARPTDGDLAAAASSLAALADTHGQLELRDRALALADAQYLALGRTDLTRTPTLG